MSSIEISLSGLYFGFGGGAQFHCVSCFGACFVGFGVSFPPDVHKSTTFSRNISVLYLFEPSSVSHVLVCISPATYILSPFFA